MVIATEEKTARTGTPHLCVISVVKVEAFLYIGYIIHHLTSLKMGINLLIRHNCSMTGCI
jgi:hypothetical protein